MEELWGGRGEGRISPSESQCELRERKNKLLVLRVTAVTAAISGQPTHIPAPHRHRRAGERCSSHGSKPPEIRLLPAGRQAQQRGSCSCETGVEAGNLHLKRQVTLGGPQKIWWGAALDGADPCGPSVPYGQQDTKQDPS